MVVEFRWVGQSMERMVSVIMPQSRENIVSNYLCRSRGTKKKCEFDDVINYCRSCGLKS